MKKFLMGVFCLLLVLGVASMGHAGLFGLFGGGGGHGKGKGGRGASAGMPSGLFNFDFSQFGVKPDPEEDDPDNSASFEPYYLNLPGRGFYYLASNHHDGDSNHHDNDSNFSHLNFDSIPMGNWQSENVSGATAPVPEPASMLLFGTGLLVFSFARRIKKA